MFPPFPMIQLGSLGKRCKLPQRVRAEPGRQTIFGEFRNQAPDNKHFDWIFNQLTVKSLHKLIYIRNQPTTSSFLYITLRSLSTKNQTTEDRPQSFDYPQNNGLARPADYSIFGRKWTSPHGHRGWSNTAARLVWRADVGTGGTERQRDTGADKVKTQGYQLKHTHNAVLATQSIRPNFFYIGCCYSNDLESNWR